LNVIAALHLDRFVRDDDSDNVIYIDGFRADRCEPIRPDLPADAQPGECGLPSGSSDAAPGAGALPDSPDEKNYRAVAAAVRPVLEVRQRMQGME
jgi:hypothetical protein